MSLTFAHSGLRKMVEDSRSSLLDLAKFEGLENAFSSHLEGLKCTSLGFAVETNLLPKQTHLKTLQSAFSATKLLEGELTKWTSIASVARDATRLNRQMTSIAQEAVRSHAMEEELFAARSAWKHFAGLQDLQPPDFFLRRTRPDLKFNQSAVARLRSSVLEGIRTPAVTLLSQLRADAERWAKSLERLRSPLFDRAKWREACQKCCDVLHRLGWPPLSGDIPASWVFDLAKLAELDDNELEARRADIEAALLAHYDQETLEALLGRLADSGLTRKCHQSLQEAFSAHALRHYTVVPATLIGVIEQLFVSAVGHQGRFRNAFLDKYSESIVRTCENPMDSSLPRFVKTHYIQGFDHGDAAPETISRNFVAHGGDPDAANATMSLRAIIFAIRILELSRYVAHNNGSRVHRTGGCAAARRIDTDARIFYSSTDLSTRDGMSRCRECFSEAGSEQK